MRLHIALHVVTQTWYISNLFSNPNAVEDWISKQEEPEGYIAISCDIQGQAWSQVKNNIDHLVNNTCLDARMAVSTTQVQGEQVEVEVEVKTIPEPVFTYSTQDLTNFRDEQAALEKKLDILEQEIVALTKKEKDEDYGSIQSSMKTRLLSEREGIIARINYVIAQIGSTPVGTSASGISITKDGIIDNKTGATGTTIADRMSAMKNKSNT